jgi:hypothetical protein
LFKRELLRIVLDAYRLGMALMVPVRRMFDLPSGIADLSADNARYVAQDLLHAPETAAGQVDYFGCFVL